jgi:hypothetical protein
MTFEVTGGVGVKAGELAEVAPVAKPICPGTQVGTGTANQIETADPQDDFSQFQSVSILGQN